MKKRILSLVLSMVLLIITAAPAFAFDAVDSTVPNLPALVREKSATINGTTYSVSATRNDDSTRYHYYIDDAYFNPSIDPDVVFDGVIEEGVYSWSSSQYFNSTYRTDIMSICDEIHLVDVNYSRNVPYTFTLNGDLFEGLYAVTLSCWHYEVSVSAALAGGGTFTQTIDYMPVEYGDYVYLTY